MIPDSEYNRQVDERIRNNSREVFGNYSRRNARYIFSAFLKNATQSVSLLTGGMPTWFYSSKDEPQGEQVFDELKNTAQRLYADRHEAAAGAIRILAIHHANPDGSNPPKRNAELDKLADEITREVTAGVPVVQVRQAKYSADPADIRHRLVVDHFRFRLEAPHQEFDPEHPEDAVVAEVCCNNPEKSRSLEETFDRMWDLVAPKG